ncbi:MAG TPA: hypothetical protein DCR64_08010 [Vibrio sp.]|nr:hypothetical protein [Vibrio sp.]
MKGHKCKGRRPNGQLKKGYTLKNGRVVRANTTRKRYKKPDKFYESKEPFSYECGSFDISPIGDCILSI